MYNRQLDTFIKIADCGSFGKAAEALFISPPAIIQQMNLLEERCGFKLFERSHHGVRLTPAGKSFYEDARMIIKLSENALDNGRMIAHASMETVRVGTSTLFKCRRLPDLWPKVHAQYPDMKIEILPISEHQSREGRQSDLGVKYDIFEGVYCSISWQDTLSFLELSRTPICCAVSKGHRLTGYKELDMHDLNGEYLVMPIKGVSAELDAFRSEVQQHYPTVQIIDSSYYGVDVFMLCEVNPYVLITQPVYSDIHPNLVSIPLKTEYTMPYGLMYAKEPSAATQKFIDCIRKLE